MAEGKEGAPVRLDSPSEFHDIGEWVRLFAKALPNWACLRCNQFQPGILAPGSAQEDIPLPTIDRTTGSMLAYLPILAVAFSNCGHIELFDQAIILKNGSRDE
jgi:hypothetical protein